MTISITRSGDKLVLESEKEQSIDLNHDCAVGNTSQFTILGVELLAIDALEEDPEYYVA
ncbi:hypothetical protein [Photobacterium kasasachensis]|uniref:hypothetical protein n=1 Tax=Photobacterium kasasachensis TaxID=2910240 RepID=UPI003D0E314B